MGVVIAHDKYGRAFLSTGFCGVDESCGAADLVFH
jgi:hypothetical protein